MRLHHLLATAAAVLLIVGLPTAAAAADDGPSEATVSFAPSKADSPATMNDHIVLRSPDGPDAPPSALEALRVEAPAGTRFDTSVAPLCDASDVELLLRGPAACPDSTIGDGSLDALTGVGLVDPLHTKATLLNAEGGPISILQEPLTGLVLTVDRFTIDGNALVAHPPAIPGASPELRTTNREIEHHWSAGFVRTPTDCPQQGWRFTVTIGFADGTTQTAGGTTACSG